ncbi:trace amine-associated receptor 4-like [Hypanus sabinus]|uniref:trace amine-associated receptor 4-like n=1 Tax=Hypanus sabinus TaxID=79690 RepID=UPI0028C4A7B7|nr:trace amine-associated receptor 4-like [Hypanus sabinus]
MNLTYLENPDDVQYCFQFVNTSCPKVTRPIAIKATLYIFISFSILISIFGNLVVIISVLHFKQLQTPTNYLVLSLAFVDFLVGFVVLPYSMIRSIETCWYFGHMFCKIHSILDIMLTIVSIYNICFIAVDRYYAISDPFLYSIKITLPVTIVTVSLIWLFAIFYGFRLILSDFSKKSLDDYILATTCEGSCIAYAKFEGHVDALIVFCVPVSIILGIYVKIFFVLKCKHGRVIGNMPSNSNNLEENNTGNLRKKQQIAVKNQSAIMGIFTFSWLPFYVNNIFDPYFNFLIPTALGDVITWFGFFNSTLNPILYAYLYPWYRKTLKLMLSCEVFNSDSATMDFFSE